MSQEQFPSESAPIATALSLSRPQNPPAYIAPRNYQSRKPTRLLPAHVHPALRPTTAICALPSPSSFQPAHPVARCKGTPAGQPAPVQAAPGQPRQNPQAVRGVQTPQPDASVPFNLAFVQKRVGVDPLVLRALNLGVSPGLAKVRVTTR